jgi:hypothetical protein
VPQVLHDGCCRLLGIENGIASEMEGPRGSRDSSHHGHFPKQQAALTVDEEADPGVYFCDLFRLRPGTVASVAGRRAGIHIGCGCFSEVGQ